MGRATPLILSVSTPAYMQVSIEASDGNRYDADLSSLSRVYCFPRAIKEWSEFSIDSYGLALIWASRFEVHVDQIVGLSTHVERIETAKTVSTHPERHV
jgi:hypothetical protein